MKVMEKGTSAVTCTKHARQKFLYFMQQLDKHLENESIASGIMYCSLNTFRI